MTTTQKLIAECQSRGIVLEPRGDKLWIEPEEFTTPELVEQLRAHKIEILASLEAKHFCKAVLLSEFSGCSARTANRIADALLTLPKSANRDAALVKLAEEAAQ